MRLRLLSIYLVISLLSPQWRHRRNPPPPPGNYNFNINWGASPSSTVIGYNVYRGIQSGGPYGVVASNTACCNYVDAGLQSGTYYYTATSIDGQGNESAYSNEASISTQ